MAITGKQLLTFARDIRGSGQNVQDKAIVLRAGNLALAHLAGFRRWSWLRDADCELLTTVKYDTGSVTVGIGDSAIVGTGTTFASGMANQLLGLGSSRDPFRLGSFVDATNMGLKNPFYRAGGDAAGVGYSIYTDTYALDSSILYVDAVYSLQGDIPLQGVTPALMHKLLTDGADYGEPYKWALLRGSDGVLSLRFWPIPDQVFRLGLLVYRTPGQYSSVDDSVAIPTFVEAAFFALFRRELGSLLGDQALMRSGHATWLEVSGGIVERDEGMVEPFIVGSAQSGEVEGGRILGGRRTYITEGS